MTNELKPCPFCGASAIIAESSINGRMCTYGLIEHKPDCWLAYDVPRHKQEIPRAEFDAWNRRANEEGEQWILSLNPARSAKAKRGKARNGTTGPTQMPSSAQSAALS